MKYHEKLAAMREFVAENFTTASELVEWLELTPEDVMLIFPDALVNAYDKVYPLDLEELDDLSNEQELLAWNGVEVFGTFLPSEDFYED
jgi:hypothetical protein